jgi:hypothetical protein
VHIKFPSSYEPEDITRFMKDKLEDIFPLPESLVMVETNSGFHMPACCCILPRREMTIVVHYNKATTPTVGVEYRL